MSDAHGQVRTEIAAAASLLLETWEQLASSHKMIGGGCSCGAGGIVLGLADFEQDIGDYLRNAGEQHQRRDVLTLLDQCARERDRWSVVQLLTRLAEPATPMDDLVAAKFVLERLAHTVASFNELHGGR